MKQTQTTAVKTKTRHASMIEMYDMACAALTWEPSATYVLPDEATMKEAHEARKQPSTQVTYSEH